MTSLVAMLELLITEAPARVVSSRKTVHSNQYATTASPSAMLQDDTAGMRDDDARERRIGWRFQ
jgi:hypothetical protein